jgi:hypothetical protein
MALNQIAYPVKSYKSGHFNIVTGTTINTNLDGTGALNLITEQGSATPLAVTDRGDIRKVQISLNGNLATATAVRFFRSTSPTAPTASNTVYLFDLLLPVTTFATTTAYTPTVVTFEGGEFPLGAGEYLYCAVTATITNGADVIVNLNKYDE